jgi:hypothetical protein
LNQLQNSLNDHFLVLYCVRLVSAIGNGVGFLDDNAGSVSRGLKQEIEVVRGKTWRGVPAIASHLVEYRPPDHNPAIAGGRELRQIVIVGSGGEEPADDILAERQRVA